MATNKKKYPVMGFFLTIMLFELNKMAAVTDVDFKKIVLIYKASRAADREFDISGFSLIFCALQKLQKYILISSGDSSRY